MKRKGVEVYFVIYLATIISFFAIEGEVKNYKERQKDIIEVISREKIEQLVNIDRVEPVNDIDSLTLNVKLVGYYNPESLEGVVRFDPVLVDDSVVYESHTFPLILMTSGNVGWYSARIPKVVFGEFGTIPYNVTAEIQVSPAFNEEVRQRWLADYKDEKVVKKLIETIDRVGHISLVKSLPNAIVPSGGGNLSAFTLQSAKTQYSALVGLQWEVQIFVGGVNSKDDFHIEIVEGATLVQNENLAVPEMKISGQAKTNGQIVVIGTRVSDNEQDTVAFNIQVRPPIWVRTPTTREVYIGEQYTFDGSLLDIPSENMQVKVTGSGIEEQERLIPGSRAMMPTFENVGDLFFQVLVNGVEIPNMNHSVIIKTPPPPDIKLISREPAGSNNLVFELVTYGQINEVISFQQRGGIIRNQQLTDPDIRGNKKYYRWLVELEKPFKENETFQEISFKVWDKYEQFSEHRKQYQYNF
mgnify:FL=1|jgi:hypothetical protein